jgi:hypothetical protein
MKKVKANARLEGRKGSGVDFLNFKNNNYL